MRVKVLYLNKIYQIYRLMRCILCTNNVIIKGVGYIMGVE